MLAARDAPSRVAPGTLGVVLVLWALAAFAIEPHGGRVGELAIAAACWVLLILVGGTMPRQDRFRVGAVVLVASVAEVLCSLVIGLYSYRRGGIPAFVPPGHGLIYIAGWCFASSGFVQRNSRRVASLGVGVAAAWALVGLVAFARPDVGGALWAVALCVLLLRGRAPGLFACVFVVVTLLELYGTALDTWRWAPVWPGLEVPVGNPPSGVAVGYCLFDVAAFVLAPRLSALAARARYRAFPSRRSSDDARAAGMGERPPIGSAAASVHRSSG